MICRGTVYSGYRTGAIRDVVQNHMLQVLATVLADPPDGTGLAALRDAKSRVIPSLRPLTPEVVVRGQYDGYHDVKGFHLKSTTETYVALRLAADSWRSQLRRSILIWVASCMPVTATEIDIRFRKSRRMTCSASTRSRSGTRCASGSGRRPRSASAWRARSRAEGSDPSRRTAAFAGQEGSDMRPYDRLIGAALDGDRWLFARQDTVEAAWEVVNPVLGDVTPVHPYARGSWGPEEADRLLPDRETWHDPAG